MLLPRWSRPLGALSVPMGKRALSSRPPLSPSPSPLPSSEEGTRQYKRLPVCRVLTDPGLVGQHLEVSGWVRANRGHKGLTFLDVDDGGDPVHNRLQVVMEERRGEKGEQQQQQQQQQQQVKFHSSVSVRGVLRESAHPKQEVELAAESVRVHNATADNGEQSGKKKRFRASEISAEEARFYYPFAPRKVYQPRFSRLFPAYRAKLPEFASLLRVRSALAGEIHRHLRDRGFVHVHTPVLTTNDCEGGCEVFTVRPLGNPGGTDAAESEEADEESGEDEDEEEEEEEEEEEREEARRGLYSRDQVFLTVSGQLHLEAVCNGISKAYNFAPAFRVEGRKSRRHLTEFTMVETEEAFVEDLSHVLAAIEELLKDAVGSTLDVSAKDVETHGRITKQDNVRAVEKLLADDFVTISYEDAFQILNQRQDRFQTPPKHGHSLGREHELYLTEKHCGGVPVFVVDWPASCKPFYAKELPGCDPSKVDAVDLLVPSVGELVGGSLREHRPDVLERRIAASFGGSSPEQCGLQWYHDMRRLGGSAPTGGFGLGFDRLVQFLLGVTNIRDAVPFARTPYSCVL